MSTLARRASRQDFIRGLAALRVLAVPPVSSVLGVRTAVTVMLRPGRRSGLRFVKAGRLALQVRNKGVIPLDSLIGQAGSRVRSPGEYGGLREVDAVLVEERPWRGLLSCSEVALVRAYVRRLVDDDARLVGRADRAVVCAVAR